MLRKHRTLAIVATLAIGGGVVAIAIRPRFAARVHGRMRDFSAIVMAIECCDDYEESMPKALHRDPFGCPCYSWRCQVVGWLVDTYPFTRDVPWFAPENVLYQDSPLGIYCSSLGDQTDSINTTVWAITGPGTAFDPERPRRFHELPGSLILLIETGDSRSSWLEDSDLDVASVPSTIVTGTSGNGVIVAFADKTAWFLDQSVPLDTLSTFFTIAGAQHSNRDELLGPFRRYFW